MRSAHALVLTLAALALVGAGPVGDEADLARGRALGDLTSAESLRSLAAAATPQLAGVIESAGGPAAMATGLGQQLGAREAKLGENVLTLNGATVYRRLDRHAQGLAVTTLAWMADGKVSAAQVRPAPAAPEDAGPPRAVALPFGTPSDGQWLTYWGGDEAAANYHLAAGDQAFAYDFLVVRDGATFRGPASDPAAYHCWGEPVLAPADGQVVEVVSDIQDNRPVGAMNAQAPAGNHVIIDQGEGVYALLGHLQHGSIAVEEGERVRAGQRLGACGNSGASSEPHVHFHLQDRGTFGPPARGVPAVFSGLRIDGQAREHGRPVRGQTVAPSR